MSSTEINRKKTWESCYIPAIKSIAFHVKKSKIQAKDHYKILLIWAWLIRMFYCCSTLSTTQFLLEIFES